MRRWQRGRCFGLIMAAVGIIIVLAMILPTFVWWFLLAGALIACGLVLIFN
ncbi:MAG: 2-oxoglutarate translocator [Oscillospiraceae bacterium]|nr:2-oxoglutarate translocator [Oscillospiraceae bacterium]